MRATIWQNPSNIPPLDAGAIHLWQANTLTLAHAVDAFAAVVAPDERARGNAFHAPADRMRHLVTRGVLRTLVGRYLATSPSAVCFEVGTFGKPSVVSPLGARLTFNVSHSGDIVLLAFAREGELGVDVERWNPRLGEVERTRIGENVFTRLERAAIATLSSAADQERAFYALWSRKEAYLKGTGAGISAGLAHVEVSAGEDARLIDDRRDPLARDRWTLRDIDVGPGYAAALASALPDREVELLMASLHLFDAGPT